MENAAKRKFVTRESYQPQYSHNNQNQNQNQKLMVESATNTECKKPMMLNAWTQTETDDFKVLTNNRDLVDDLQERLRKLEEMFRAQSIAFHENQSNQSQTISSNCINGKTNNSVRKSPSTTRPLEKATYKIVAGPAGMEIIEPIEVEYAEEDGTYLDNDMNTSNDSNRLEICLPKEEFSPSLNEQQQQHQSQHQEQKSQQNQHQHSQHQQHNVEQISQNQQNIYTHYTTTEHQIQTVPTHQIQTIHNSQLQQHTPLQTTQIYHTQINGNGYHTINHNTHQNQPIEIDDHQHGNNNSRSVQYISVVHPNMIPSQPPNGGHVQQQQQNVIITSQSQTNSNSISPIPNSNSLKSNQRTKSKTDVRHYINRENLHNDHGPEVSNEVTVPAVSSSSLSDIKRENTNNDNVSQSSQRSSGNGQQNYGMKSELNDVEVSLGPNNTRIPAVIYEAIDWNSVTSATRKLLITIFDRETLATHTMTGKPSPAFKGRDLPSKHQLNQQAVQDIIFAVSRKCNVAEKEVRAAITTKCADENKMLKQRERKRRSLHESNKENLTKL